MERGTASGSSASTRSGVAPTCGGRGRGGRSCDPVSSHPRCPRLEDPVDGAARATRPDHPGGPSRSASGRPRSARSTSSNIYHATHLAMRRAIARVGGHEHVLVDGNRIAGFEAQVGAYTNIVDGDAKVYSIACASVVAKVVRDRMMTQLAAPLPRLRLGAQPGLRDARPPRRRSARWVSRRSTDARSWRSSGRSRATSSTSTCSATQPRRRRRTTSLERELVPVMVDDAAFDAVDLGLAGDGRRSSAG